MADIPQLFAQMFRASFGETAWQQYQNSLEHPRVRGLRINSLRAVSDRLTFHLPVPWNPRGFIIDLQDRIGNDPLHAAGVVYLQEPTAMAPVAVLEPKPGERILDLCAAPGGKTTQIGAAMDNQGFLLANEINRSRAQALVQNVERIGLTHTTVSAVAPDKLTGAYSAFFDAVLVDAPCSAEGLFRREPEAKLMWSIERVETLAQQQLTILESAYTMLKEQGRIVYSTCTFNPIENECVVAKFIASHHDLSLQKLSLAQSDQGLSWTQILDAAKHSEWLHTLVQHSETALKHTDTSYCARFFPFHCEGEGHFLALIERKSHDSLKAPHIKREAAKHRASQRDEQALLETYASFARDTLTPIAIKQIQESRHFLAQNGVLFAVSKDTAPMPAYLRPGLPLLHLVNKRAAPEHALAMTLQKDDVLRACSLPYGDQKILDYLAGHPIPCDSQNGWCLVLIDDAPIGWGKASQGVLKNHYPKGLRRQYEFAR